MNTRARKAFENDTIDVISNYPSIIAEDIYNIIQKRHSLQSDNILKSELDFYFSGSKSVNVSLLEFQKDILEMCLRSDILVDPDKVNKITERWYSRVNGES